LLVAQETLKVNVKVVNVLATVRDRRGQIVNDLSAQDFRLDEDGRPQNIRYFSRQSDQPLTLGLLIDTSASVREVLEQERRASATFLQQVLREDKDQAFLIHFDFEVELLQDLTASRAKLLRALDEVQATDPHNPYTRRTRRDPNADPRRDPGDARRTRRGAGTSFYDAVFLAADEVLKKQPGRKALIVLTDGRDEGSKLSLAEAIEAAQRADTVVYAIYFKTEEAFIMPPMGGRRGGGWPGGGRGPRRGEEQLDGKKVLERLVNETGGRMFELTKKQTAEQIYAQIQEELRNQYNIGYSSDQPAQAPAYRKIHVATNRKDAVVQARDGYYAEP
jgi:VWFA-related protein